MENSTTIHFNWFYKMTFLAMILAFMVFGLFGPALAKGDEPPEEPRQPVEEGMIGISAAIQTGSAGVAWGDPDGLHSVYDWPFSVVQMGHVIQSYQNYSSGTSAAYFHHGTDMIAPDGTDVYTRSGGQVVNVENYQPGNSLYWEIAILDAEGYVWQYHHIDRNTIPQAILDKYNEWLNNPSTGGYIPANTYIGDIVYWTVTSFGYRFNHVHLNILAAGDAYLNPLEFHTLLNDTQSPEIQAVGLLNGNTLVSGNIATGNYGMYVRTRDLFLSSVYYLPPYKTEFSIDGGPWTTVWEFDDLPGGAIDTAYVNDFYVAPPTDGDYSIRDFYIDLGFTTGGQRSFPSDPGDHNIQVCVWDYNGNSTCNSFAWTVALSIPDNGCASSNGVTRTFDVTEDLLVEDINLGLNINHATRGQLRVTLKAPGDASATTIVNTSTDTYDNYDVLIDDASSSNLNDGSNDTTSAPFFDRTAGPNANGSLDSFNGKLTQGTWTVFICDNVSGTTGTFNRIYLDITGRPRTNTAPVANPQTIDLTAIAPVQITLTGSDADGNPLTYSVITNPSKGTLSGAAPNLTFTPNADFSGTDTFDFIVNDGQVDSPPATVTLRLNPTSVEILSFTATAARTSVTLNWVTAQETNNTGFNLYRATSSTGSKTKINSSLIPSKVPGSSSGAAYSYTNTGLKSNTTYYYWLEDVDTSGNKHLTGPIMVKTTKR